MKVYEVIQVIIDNIPGAPLKETTDKLVSGDLNQNVTGVITTFTATMDVLRKAVQLGANMIITHEDTFNKLENQSWFQSDDVYLNKLKYIEDNHLAIFRLHDYWHMYKSDGIITGLMKSLGWLEFRDESILHIANVPGLTNHQVIEYLKSTLKIASVRFVGNLDAICNRVAFAVGSLPGDIQISMYQQKVDTLICGETVEWQTCEYVRDANLQGQKKGLIIVGHANSEEVGMADLVDWLRPKLPDVSIEFIEAGDPITFI